MNRLDYYACAMAIVTALLFSVKPAAAAISGLEPIASGLNFPVFATHAPGDRDRMFVLEIGGNIKIVDLNTKTVTGQFLNVPDTAASGEGGLLGMAFHPEYSTDGADGFGKFYVYVTVNDDGTSAPFASHVREYTLSANPNVADPASKREILRFVQPQSNHNAGWIGFSPNDNYLYISSGDGGGGFDSDSGHTAGTGNAQDVTNNLLGKMLRVDVNGDDFAADPNRNYAIPDDNPFVGETGDDEIWSFGLRNPFRDSFDRITGDLWIGDVGQNQREEIDFQPASSTGGENYGWRLREGNVQTGNVGGPAPAGYVPPVYDYTRGSGEFQGETVTGGYVYRGPDPDLQGLYFFADSNDDNAWTLSPTNPVASVDNIETELGAQFANVNRIVSLGEDAVGNLYYVDMHTGANDNPNPNTGQLWRVLTNNLIDGDFNADGQVDQLDYEVWKDSFSQTIRNDPLSADANGNGVVDAADYTVWRDSLGASVHNLGESTSVAESTIPEPITLLMAAQLMGFALITAHRTRRRAANAWRINAIAVIMAR